MTQLPPWLLALAAAVPVLAVLGWWWSRRTPPDGPPLPREWALASRPVFNVHERRVLRQMREAFPEHVILAKLPLVRLCQPLDPSQVQYWFGLLATIHVGFLVCSVNGRVLAAIDLDEGGPLSARSQHIKQSVLGACGIRYVRYPANHLPAVAELQMLVPPGAGLPGTIPVGAPPGPPGGRERRFFCRDVRPMAILRLHGRFTFQRQRTRRLPSHGERGAPAPRRRGQPQPRQPLVAAEPDG